MVYCIASTVDRALYLLLIWPSPYTSSENDYRKTGLRLLRGCVVPFMAGDLTQGLLAKNCNQ